MTPARTTLLENWSFKAGESGILRALMLGGGSGVDIVNGIGKFPTTSDLVVCQLLLQWASGAPLSPPVN